MSKGSKDIPVSVISRLTRYLAEVQRLHGEDIEWVSSQDLADTLGLTSSTVRQDLSHLDFSGTCRKGYKTSGLEESLARALGADSMWSMVVVGVGNLGKALALHGEFKRRGFDIRGVFDSDKKKVGKKVGKLTIRNTDEIPKFIRKERIDIGLIAVPPQSAQAVADVMIASGIRGLLNLSLSHIVAPKRVPVVSTRVVASLLQLAHAIKFQGE